MEEFKYSSLSSENAEMLNSVVGRNRVIPFSLRGQELSFVFGVKSPSYEPTLAIKVQIKGRELWIGVNHLPDLSIFSDKLAGLELQDVPEELCPLIVEAFSEDVVESLELYRTLDMKIEDVWLSPPPGESAYPLYFKVSRADGVHILEGHFQTDWEGVKLFADLLKHAPVDEYQQLDDIPVWFSLVLGRTHLKIQDYENLAINDIVLVDEICSQDKNHYSFYSNDYGSFEASLENGKANVVNVMESENMEKAGAQSAEKTDINELPVNLSFEAGEKAISLGELKKLQPGYTFELENPASKPLTIKANGKVLGSGEFVKIGERVGVRVLELGKNG